MMCDHRTFGGACSLACDDGAYDNIFQYDANAHAMESHPLFGVFKHIADDAAFWASRLARGGSLAELESNRKYSIFGDMFEVELARTMQRDFACHPSIRCFKTNYERPDEPDFICPLNRTWDFELKTTCNSKNNDIRCGGESHTRKKPCYYVHVRYDPKTFKIKTRIKLIFRVRVQFKGSDIRRGR